ncbi:MAE_28990/MAE_18760 family HEPN-like nuclease [Dendronalium sp. ChiSLP03b]|uniref:MAE_28990/MAE_18760 family HEPN-like nuclease n=1 Tax=Dendronalium sp. ChiSLP03b TaxID=3075381 RepID=UPI002AD52E22|nr:MAE_28990/MAE_18760 family HEPN-like nuclease [Dendronalium sp. ChiSLP03b]MDZ8207217.1 MAE_28990/MAE_18760 family HEPN-like nuclease [Dendronalium sp. ChiSLP03b]
MSNWYQELEKDLNWREAELASLKRQVITTTKGTVAHKVLLRAVWALLYAHYEGFCKFAWDLYLDELQKSGVKRKECKDEIARLSLQKQFKELKGDLTSENIWNFAQIYLQNLLEENIDFQVKLETESNLYPNVFIDNSRQVCLDCILVDQYKIELRTLVARRNYIAHGKEMVIKDIQEYQKYEKAALEVMHELAISIVECLDKKLYLKIP